MSKTILVTGASSFIAGWIIQYLLEKGYNVRGTVRSATKEKQVLDGIAEEYRKQISFVHVADITSDSFDEAVRDVDGIIHVASPFHFKVTDPEKDLLLPAINGTTRVLQAAHDFNQNNENKIKRVVITSSFAAVIDPSKSPRPGYVYTEKDWSPITYEQGVAAKDDPLTAYRASKVCAEQAAWNFIEQNKPAFTIATICEPMVFGPSVRDFQTVDDIHQSNALIWSLVTSGKDAPIPDTRVPKQVDVRDVAFTHVAALEKMIDSNQRYLIANDQNWTQQQIADIVHQSSLVPQNIKQTTPIGSKDYQLPDFYTIDSSKAKQELGVTYTPFQKTIEDLTIQFGKLQQTLKQ